jgi:hypothetical protein
MCEITACAADPKGLLCLRQAGSMILNMASSEIHKSSLNGKFQWEHQRKIWEDVVKFSKKTVGCAM